VPVKFTGEQYFIVAGRGRFDDRHRKRRDYCVFNKHGAFDNAASRWCRWTAPPISPTRRSSGSSAVRAAKVELRSENPKYPARCSTPHDEVVLMGELVARLPQGAE
jgi:hypothetical protein